MDEELLRKNLTLIQSVAERAGVEIILAFKVVRHVAFIPHFPRVHPLHHGQLALRGPFGL